MIQQSIISKGNDTLQDFYHRVTIALHFLHPKKIINVAYIQASLFSIDAIIVYDDGE